MLEQPGEVDYIEVFAGLRALARNGNRVVRTSTKFFLNEIQCI